MKSKTILNLKVKNNKEFMFYNHDMGIKKQINVFKNMIFASCAAFMGLNALSFGAEGDGARAPIQRPMGAIPYANEVANCLDNLRACAGLHGTPNLGLNRDTTTGGGKSNTQAQEQRKDDNIADASSLESKLDELNRNIYEVDKSMMENKGYVGSEDVFRHTPFMQLTNTGNGYNIDLRGQGSSASSNVQVLVNGIYTNSSDSQYAISPLNTISPDSIEQIDILPSSGAVLYGSGTRGGVVNIITQRRYNRSYFSAGGNYSNLLGTSFHSYNADAKFGLKLGNSTFISIGGSYMNLEGPRNGDRKRGANANAAIFQDFGEKHSIRLDADYFYGMVDGSPNNSFNDIKEPSKANRREQGNGEYRNTVQRLDTSLTYLIKSDKNSLDLKLFYHFDRTFYNHSIATFSEYQVPIGNGTNTSGQSASATVDQSGSSFREQKIGFIGKYDWKPSDKFRLITGLESVYNYNNRLINQHVNAPGTIPQFVGATFVHFYNFTSPFQGIKLQNSVFSLAEIDFTDKLSLVAGARYENTQYFVDISGTKEGRYVTGQINLVGFNAANSFKRNIHSWALEVTPSFNYRENGALYLKYEKGFLTPSSNILHREIPQATNTPNHTNIRYESTNLQQEEYHTFELGVKDTYRFDKGFFSGLALSGAFFYILTQNEIYAIGNPLFVDGLRHNNYDLTSRLGVELLSEQSFFDDSLKFSESSKK